MSIPCKNCVLFAMCKSQVTKRRTKIRIKEEERSEDRYDNGLYILYIHCPPLPSPFTYHNLWQEMYELFIGENYHDTM